MRRTILILLVLVTSILVFYFYDSNKNNKKDAPARPASSEVVIEKKDKALPVEGVEFVEVQSDEVPPELKFIIPNQAESVYYAVTSERNNYRITFFSNTDPETLHQILSSRIANETGWTIISNEYSNVLNLIVAESDKYQAGLSQRIYKNGRSYVEFQASTK